MQYSIIHTGILLEQGLGIMRIGTQRLGRMRMRTGRPGTRDDKENKIVFENV
jgi:hypothetical protein